MTFEEQVEKFKELLLHDWNVIRKGEAEIINRDNLVLIEIRRFLSQLISLTQSITQEELQLQHSNLGFDL